MRNLNIWKRISEFAGSQGQLKITRYNYGDYIISSHQSLPIENTVTLYISYLITVDGCLSNTEVSEEKLQDWHAKETNLPEQMASIKTDSC